jgi:hypothetical protein
MKPSSATAAFVAVMIAAACGDNGNPAEQQPANTVSAAVITLTTPNSDDGAIVLTLQGPDLAAIEPASSAYLSYSRATSNQEKRVIVIGNLGAGPLFTVKLGSAHNLSDYSATVEQVANRSDILRNSTTDYKLTIAAAQ